MFRLFKTASLKANNINFSKSSFPQSSVHVVPCALCKNEYVFLSGSDLPLSANFKLFARHLSIEEFITLKNAIKKKKKNRKKYAELVEVKEDRSNVRKAVVRNLSPQDVARFTEKPEISLEKLHLSINKNRQKPSAAVSDTEKSHSKTKAPSIFENEYDYLLSKINLSPVNNEDLKKKMEEEIECELIQRDMENIDMFSNADLKSRPSEKHVTDISSNPTVKKLSKKDKQRIADENLHEIKQKIKNKKFQDSLTLYTQLCVECNLLDMAYNKLRLYYKGAVSNLSKAPLSDPHPFNILIHGFAKRGDINTITKLIHMMTHCDIGLTPQTFAGCFECFGRLPDTPTNKLQLESILREFLSLGFSFQDLFSKCIYAKDQREHVLKTIQRINPNFKPFYEPPSLYYSCDVLQKLNEKAGSFRSASEGLITEEEMVKFTNEQQQIELKGFQKIKTVHLARETTDKIKFYKKKWEELENQWRKSIRKGFLRNLEQLKQTMKMKPAEDIIHLIHPCLVFLTADEYVDIIINELYNLLLGSENYSPCTKMLYVNMGRQARIKCETKFHMRTGVIGKVNKLYSSYSKWYLHPQLCTEDCNTRHYWQRILHENAGIGCSININLHPWSQELYEKIGEFLYNIIIDDVKIANNGNFYQAFYPLRRIRGTHDVEELKPHKLLVTLYRRSAADNLIFPVELLPMICPPVPWSSRTKGGYLYTQVDLIRICKLSDALPDTLTKTPDAKFYPVLDSLNQLSSVPWKINESILDIMLGVFKKGGSDELDIPRPASSLNIQSLFKSDMNNLNNDKKKYFINQRKGEMHSLWCECLYRLSLANHYRKRIFWLPHNMDFRGRVYPVPPHLNHIGSDLSRALLLFAKGEKLGSEGLNWLKIHCINLTGLKKRSSIADRLTYANEVLPDILDSAENPLTGKMWWTKSEEIWQTLACCMEIKAVLDSDDPENFVSHFPIHQDGSCNGLQHYAALGRDVVGGKSVNLIPSAVPQDVYTSVVELVERERKKDAKMGSEVANILEGFVQRKVIKQTIMTTVYGVTSYGARLQIQKQLKDIKGFPEDQVRSCAAYLAEKTFHSLREMFTSAREIQDWFTFCAQVISNDHDSCIEWRTPLDFPVVQLYLRKRNSLKLNKGKQKNAFPPNFVHSLDSSHMMLTSLHCEREGITFISVHDCFWTHACSVHTMNKICREQFVVLHSLPILENLSKFFSQRYVIDDNSTCYNRRNSRSLQIFLQVPKRGSLNLLDVLRSEYFFS